MTSDTKAYSIKIMLNGLNSIIISCRCIGAMGWLLWTMFSRNTKTFTRKLSVLLLVVNTNLLVSIVTISNEQGVWLINQMISWLCFGAYDRDSFACDCIYVTFPFLSLGLSLNVSLQCVAWDCR